MGNPSSSFFLTFREIYSLMPFSEYFFCGTTQEVSIQIFEQFDNDDFGLQTIDFLVPNEALQFKSANLRVTTILSGVRYFMYNWWLTTALVCIFVMTSVFSVSSLFVLLCLKQLYL